MNCRRFWESGIPLLAKEGWTRHQENVAKPLLMERTGWSIYQNVSECGFASSLTTPSARNKDASRHFHDRASTPPHEEGNVATLGNTSCKGGECSQPNFSSNMHISNRVGTHGSHSLLNCRSPLQRSRKRAPSLHANCRGDAGVQRWVSNHLYR